jgi:hypothetical protein
MELHIMKHLITFFFLLQFAAFVLDTIGLRESIYINERQRVWVADTEHLHRRFQKCICLHPEQDMHFKFEPHSYHRLHCVNSLTA